MKEAQDMERKFPEEFNKVFDIEKYSKVFRHSVNLVKTVFGDNAFFAHTISNNKKLSLFKPTFNKGLIDVLMYGFTQYDQNQVMPYKDSLKEELIWLETTNKEFIDSISGTGTDNRKKVFVKFHIWLNSLKEIIGYPKKEPRCFSWEIKNELFKNNSVCTICTQKIESVDDAEIDHIKFYWKGGKTIPQNARLVHRFCNRSRKDNNIEESSVNPTFIIPEQTKKTGTSLDELENTLREKINSELSKKYVDYWDELIPDTVNYQVFAEQSF